MKNYEVNLTILNPDYEDNLIVALVQQGFQVFKVEPGVISTIMSEVEVTEIDLPFPDDTKIEKKKTLPN